MDRAKANDILMRMGFLDAPPEESASLKDDLGIDSLRMVELIIEMEDAYGILIEESDLDPERLVTAGDIIKLAERYAMDRENAV